MGLGQKAISYLGFWLVVLCASTVASASFTIDRLRSPVVSGNRTAYALLQDGTVVAWGYNADGRLAIGQPSQARVTVRTPVVGLSGIIAIAGANDHMLALKYDGTVFAWGVNNYGAVGDGTSGNVRTVPTMVAGLSNIESIFATTFSSFAVATDGKAYAWGANWRGQLGINNAGDQNRPVQITGTGSARRFWQIVGGINFTMGLDLFGRLWVWGSNDSGQLGDGGEEGWRTTPRSISMPAGHGSIKTIAAGNGYGLALMADGIVMGWGNGGSLARGISDNVLDPVRLWGLSDIRMIAAGESHAFAVGNDNRLWAWGKAADGQLGDGVITTEPRLWPVLVYNFDEAPGMISVGFNSTLAVTRHGQVYGWGRNGDAQVNFTTTSQISTPVQSSLAFRYKILVVAVSQSGTLNLNWNAPTPTDMMNLAAGIQRMSYQRVYPQIDYVQYHATPSQIGCLNAINDDQRATVYGLRQALAEGVDVASYNHIMFMSDHSLAPGCATAGIHGGVYASTFPLMQAHLVKPDTGYSSLGDGMNAFNFPAETTTHEFLHAYGLGANHEGVMTCPAGVEASDSACTSTDNASDAMYALGDGLVQKQYALDGVSSPTIEANESAGHKWLWGWFGPSSVYTPPPCGAWINLLPVEADHNPWLGYYYHAATLPVADGAYTVEYRNMARIGPGGANRPGLYVSYVRTNKAPKSWVLNLQTDSANYQSTAPLSFGVEYQIGTDAYVYVSSTGVDENGVERAQVAVWSKWSQCQ